jgi:hypothetical protein
VADINTVKHEAMGKYRDFINKHCRVAFGGLLLGFADEREKLASAAKLAHYAFDPAELPLFFYRGQAPPRPQPTVRTAPNSNGATVGGSNDVSATTTTTNAATLWKLRQSGAPVAEEEEDSGADLLDGIDEMGEDGKRGRVDKSPERWGGDGWKVGDNAADDDVVFDACGSDTMRSIGMLMVCVCVGGGPRL